ncbi:MULTISPECIES: heme-binding protein [unclassified Erwinia]|uniref:GlcG/HbpS family heme-binding protein n=1 Tax=unclassified Erwinia TaxID=2622719 RepID=UPI00082E8DE7|nr:heme-binding protein [Erwinia sp. ErVv1]
MKKHLLAAILLMAAAGGSQAASAPDLNADRAWQVIAQVKSTLAAAHSTGCVAVVDGDGLLLAFQRLDGAPPGCVEASLGKARTSALYHTPSLKMMQRLQKGETTVLAIPQAVALGGGYPLSLKGDVVGAVGVSTPQQELDNQASESAARSLH